MRTSSILAIVLAAISLSLPACQMRAEEGEQSHHEQQSIVVTTPQVKDIIITQPYVCQIHAQKNIEVCALQDGYLKEIRIKEGQAVKKGDVMFVILPTLYNARLAAERAEAQLAQIKFNNTKALYENKGLSIVSYPEVLLAQAELDKAKAKVQLAEAEVNFTEIVAPFDGIVDRLHRQLGSLIEKKDVLTTLSDNRLMWVYFNVPEKNYLEYKARQGSMSKDNPQHLKLADSRIELMLADGSKFKYDAGDTVTVEGKFNNETGNIPFRADFPNPDGLLRHGQTGTILIHHTVRGAVIIPQRATFEVLDKRYVWVVGEDHVARRRPITIKHELEDIFVVESGVDAKDKIVLEGVLQVRNDEKVEYEFEKPQEALTHQKFHAE